MESRNKFISFLLIVVVLFGAFYFIERDKTFIVVEDKKGDIFTIIPAQHQFSTVYIHSSEKQPWENIYKVNYDQTFTLMTMKIRSLGPGVPSNIEKGWTFYSKDGFWFYDNINMNFKYVDLKLSSISPHFIKVNEKLYNLVDICGDNADIRIMVKKGLLIDLRRFFTWMKPGSKKL